MASRSSLLTVCLVLLTGLFFAQGQVPAIEVNRTAITVNLNPGETRSVSLGISNTGGSILNWNASLDTDNGQGLQAVLDRMKTYGTDISNLIPSRYDFNGGEVGSGIDDIDEPTLYKEGNKIFISNQADRIELSYTNGLLQEEDALKERNPTNAEGTYFTTKHPGLFTFAAGTDVHLLEIEGELAGNHTGANSEIFITNPTLQGIPYRCFVKRVFGLNAPTIHHAFIVHDRTGISHLPDSNPNLDNHDLSLIANQDHIPRIYYMMFTSQAGRLVTRTRIEEMVNLFLRKVIHPTWVFPASASVGQAAPEQPSTFYLAFNATGLNAGVYEALLNIQSNDPNTPLTQIPIRLVVGDNDNSVPVISNPVDDLDVTARTERLTIDLNDHFEDDSELTFEAHTDGNFSGTVEVDGDLLKITTTELFNGETITVTARDLFNETATLAFRLNAVNRAPVVTDPSVPIRPLNLDEEFTLRLTERFEDPNRDLLTFAVSAVPATNVSIIQADNSTFRVTGAVTGAATITANATDPYGEEATFSFDVTITDNHNPVVISDIEDRSIYVNEEFTLDLSQYFADADSETLTYSVQALDPENVGITHIDDHTVKIKALKPYFPVTINITAEDPRGATVTITFLVTISNRQPQLLLSSSILEETILIDQEIIFDLPDLFADADGDALSYSMTANNPSAAIEVTRTGDRVKIKGKGVTEPGLDIPRVILFATDPHLASAALSVYVTVREASQNNPPSVASGITDKHLTIGEELAIDLGSHLTDVDNDPLTYSVSLSNDAIAGAVIDGDLLTLTAREEGETAVSVTATDPFSASATEVFILHSHLVLGVMEERNKSFSFSPNPFHETVNVTLSLPESADIKLTLTDSFGRIIATPIDGWYSAGEITQLIALTSQASGIYYYSLVINGKLFSGKILKY